VKHEDLEAKNYACGVHMRALLQDQERNRAASRRASRRTEEEEIIKWELGIYQKAYDRLSALDPEMFPPGDRPEKTSWSWRFDKTVDLDIIELERWMRSHAKDPTPVTS